MWLLNKRRLSMAAIVAIVACSSPSEGPATSSTPPQSATSATESVEKVVAAIRDGDFDTAGAYAISGHAALASLAEGASFPDVAAALRDEGDEVAANFWSGFAQGAGSFLSEGVSASTGEAAQQDGIEFEAVRLSSDDGSERVVWARDVDGYRVDLFASFGSGLADKMLGPVERLLSAQTDDTRFILARLTTLVPSLHIAADTPGVTAQARQQILSLVELITRVG